MISYLAKERQRPCILRRPFRRPKIYHHDVTADFLRLTSHEEMGAKLCPLKQLRAGFTHGLKSSQLKSQLRCHFSTAGFVFALGLRNQQR